MQRTSGVSMNRLYMPIALLALAVQVANSQVRVPTEGEWRHPVLGNRFPERVGDFSRIEVVRFAEDYSDVSVGYRLGAGDSKITITLYLYTNRSESLKTAVDLEKHFLELKAQVGRAFGGAVGPVPDPSKKWPEWRIHEVEVAVGETPPFRSALLLKTCGKYYAKARVSYVKAFADRFESEGRAVLQLLDCAADT